MTKVFLSYARADGQMEAALLRAELSRRGFDFLQDTQNMARCPHWEVQLLNALRWVGPHVLRLIPGHATSYY